MIGKKRRFFERSPSPSPEPREQRQYAYSIIDSSTTGTPAKRRRIMRSMGTRHPWHHRRWLGQVPDVPATQLTCRKSSISGEAGTAPKLKNSASQMFVTISSYSLQPLTAPNRFGNLRPAIEHAQARAPSPSSVQRPVSSHSTIPPT